MSAGRIRLGDVATTITKGSTPSIAGSQFVDSGIPFLRVDDIKGGFIDIEGAEKRISAASHAALARSQLRPDDLLITTTGSIGRVGRVPAGTTAANCNQSVTLIRVKPNVFDPGFVGYFLASAEVQELLRVRGNATTITNIGLALIRDLQVPFVSLEKQRCIAGLLSAADNLTRLWPASVKNSTQRITALFYEMFGDPAINPKGVPRVPLGSLLRSIDNGRSPICERQPKSADEWGVLKLSALTGGIYREQENKAFPGRVPPDPGAEVRCGDLLMSRKNTYDRVGTTVLVDKTVGRMLLPDLIFRLNIRDHQQLDPIYLWALLSMNTKRDQLKKLASGSASSMPNISKERLKTLLIELPPPHEQALFSAVAGKIRAIRSLQTSAADNARVTFDALLDEAYGD